MAHPSLALHDPLYWLALLLLGVAIPALIWACRPSSPHWARGVVAVAVLVLCLPSGCYAMLGTACYGFGECP